MMLPAPVSKRDAIKLVSDVPVATQQPIFLVPTPLYHYSWMFHTLPIGHTILCHVADNLTTNNVIGTIFLRLVLQVVWQTDNSDVGMGQITVLSLHGRRKLV